MSTKILIPAFIFSFFILPKAHAQEDLWQRLDKKFEKPTLCHSIENGKTYTFRRTSCSSFGCDEWNYQGATFCEQGPQGMVAQIDLIKQGKAFSRQKITQADWEATNGNFMRALAKSVESYGLRFELTEIADVDGLTRASYTVRKPDTNALVESGHWLLGDGPFLQQVLERQQQRHGLTRETNTDRLISPAQ